MCQLISNLAICGYIYHMDSEMVSLYIFCQKTKEWYSFSLPSVVTGAVLGLMLPGTCHLHLPLLMVWQQIHVTADGIQIMEELHSFRASVSRVVGIFNCSVFIFQIFVLLASALFPISVYSYVKKPFFSNVNNIPLFLSVP